jgi:hypothetical protein
MGLNYGDCIKVFPVKTENGMMENKYLYRKTNRMSKPLRQFVNKSPGKSALFFNSDIIIPELLKISCYCPPSGFIYGGGLLSILRNGRSF